MAALQSPTEGQPPKPFSRSFLDILNGQSSSFQLRQPSTYRGLPSVVFSDEDISRFSAPFRYALIGKFSNGRPPMETIRKSFVSIGFAGSHTLGLIDHRHILIKFETEEDYVRSFLKRIYSIDGFIMRIFKWTPQFSVESESAILPIWINFPLLPLHFFHKEALYSIARLIGEPLKLDASTSALSRPSVARVCVELDLRKALPEKVWIVNGNVGFWQLVDYENIPSLCSHCHKIGHQADKCRSIDTRPVPSVVAESLKKPSVPNVRLEYRPKGVNGQLGNIAVPHSANKNIESQRDAKQFQESNAEASSLRNSVLAQSQKTIATDAEASDHVTSSVHVQGSVVSDAEFSGPCNSVLEKEPKAAPVGIQGAEADAVDCLAGATTVRSPSVAIPAVRLPDAPPVVQPIAGPAADAEAAAAGTSHSSRATHPTATKFTHRPLPNIVVQGHSEASETAAAAGNQQMLLLPYNAEQRISPEATQRPDGKENGSSQSSRAGLPTTTKEMHPTMPITEIRKNSKTTEAAAVNKPFSRAELDDLLKNLSPIPIRLRPLAPVTNTVKHPSSALIPAPKIEDVAPLAVLPPEVTQEDISSDFESEDHLCYDEDMEVQSSYFQPLALSRGRGNNKALIQSDRVLRPRKKH